MGLFGQSSPFDAEIEKATSEKNTTDNWTLILDVCDKLTLNPRSAKDCLKSILKRMSHEDPHVVMQAITLLDACVNNCGKPFHLEVASRDFETEFCRLLPKMQPKIVQRMGQIFKNWAENVFKTDPELNLIPSLFVKLRAEHNFGNAVEKSTNPAKTILPKDPNVVSNQQEEDDIAKAIELSLKETKSSPKSTTGSSKNSTVKSGTYPSLYPSVTNTIVNNTSSAEAQEPRKVRALYDFEAAEDNELTFYAGEIINVLEDTDASWWKGSNERGEGLFPSNFVTADLSVDPELLDINQQHKSISKTDNKTATENSSEIVKTLSQVPEINEKKIDRLLHLLQESNPEDSSQDSEEMLKLEHEVNQMGPLIDAELERVDLKHAQLTRVSAELVDAFNLYHSLMRDDRSSIYGTHVGDMNPAGYFGTPIGSVFPAGAGYRNQMDGRFTQRLEGNVGSMPMQYLPGPYYGPAQMRNNLTSDGFPSEQQSYNVPRTLNAHVQPIVNSTLPQQQTQSNMLPNVVLNHQEKPMLSQIDHLALQQQQQQHKHQATINAIPQQQLQQLHQQHLQTQQQMNQQHFPLQQPLQQQHPHQYRVPIQHNQIPYSQPSNQQLPANYMSPPPPPPPQQQNQPQLAQPYIRPYMECQQPNQFAQQQMQQMANMTLGANVANMPARPAIGPQNYLVEHDAMKNNIPVYQQQR